MEYQRNNVTWERIISNKYRLMVDTLIICYSMFSFTDKTSTVESTESLC